jgi:uncharacterized membrane protein YfcA
MMLMVWHDQLPFIIFAVTFIASVIAGMSGGGGGYIITPFLIAIGLTAQQAIATVKLWAFGMDTGSVAAFRGHIIKYKKLAALLVAIGAVVGLVSALAIRHLGNSNLQLTMGYLNLASVPILFIKHRKLKSHRGDVILMGLGLAAVVGLMLMQGIFASGIGSLINVILIAAFGISALEANFIKRRASIVTDVVSIAALLGAGLINYRYGLIGAVAGFSGGFIGSKLAIKSGEKFARYALIVFMLVSGIWLITSA